MKNHTTFGRDVLAALPRLAHAAVDVAYSHHERMDGKGYPRGLSGQQIPLFAKIVGLVDTYDAITSSRVYDKGRASMEALQIIHRNKAPSSMRSWRWSLSAWLAFTRPVPSWK